MKGEEVPMRCTACGAIAPEGARFCAQCGLPLGNVPTDSLAETTTTFHPAVDDTSDSLPSIGLPEDIDELAQGSAFLVVQRGPGAGGRFLLDQPLVHVGRDPESEIFLDDVTVSRNHAEFLREGDGYAVVDSGSLNGTYVNRQRIERVVLVDRDEVQIGKYRFIFFSARSA